MRIVLPYVACLTPVYAYSSATSSASLNLSAAAKYCTSRQCAHQAARHHFQWEATYLKFLKGLHLLKHAYALSDEEVVQRWVQNPYDQYFC